MARGIIHRKQLSGSIALRMRYAHVSWWLFLAAGKLALREDLMTTVSGAMSLDILSREDTLDTTA